ncbi:MAG: 4-(cytidine 5'-diphospho)-2-C-methyl-D-erythritol kinase [Oligoflexia bacterium]|nr:4-(cytidine 5'-diphospho)-2-C-methyl-D-erythritol kinase [Oligoflexia bacterium]
MTSLDFTLKAPAKLNLWLHITGVREDGYHLLDSLFVPIDLYDEIKITKSLGSKDEVLFVTPSGTPLDIKINTVTKTFELMRELLPEIPYLKIQVTKHIPMGAGLGGGSSDAATTLNFLQSEYGNAESLKALPKIAQKIGADVSFFLKAKPAHVTGVGEQLMEVNIEQLFFVVCYPELQISTNQAYGWFDEDCALTRAAANVNFNRTTGVLDDSVLTAVQVVKRTHNDLEIPVEARNPQIAMLKKALRQWGALTSLMTGSGSSVFGIYQNQKKAILAYENLKKQFPASHSFFITKTLD